MDRRPACGKAGMKLKYEQVKPSSPKLYSSRGHRDSLDSDTESLAQERAYQKDLHECTGDHDQPICIHVQEGQCDDSSQQGLAQPGEAQPDDTDLQACDSLDVAAHMFDKRSPPLTPPPADSHDGHRQAHQRQPLRQVPPDGVYSELHDGPDGRTQLHRARHCSESTQPSSPEELQKSEENSQLRCGDGKGVLVKGGYRLIIPKSPAPVEIPHMTNGASEQPYHLHPKHGSVASAASPHHLRAHHYQLPQDGTQAASPLNRADEGSEPQGGPKVQGERNHNGAGEHPGSPPELEEQWKKLQPGCGQEVQTHSEPGQRHMQERAGETHTKNTSKRKSPKVLSNRKLDKVKVDIVERNKITLGRSSAKCGSYLKAYEEMRETSDALNQVCDPQNEVTGAGNLGDSSDMELRCLQKTQQLKVALIAKEKKAPWKGNPDPWRQNTPPALEVKVRPGDRLCPPTARPAAGAELDPEKPPSTRPAVLLGDSDLRPCCRLSLSPPPLLQGERSPSTQLQPVPSTIHLNTSTNRLPIQDGILTFSSVHSPHLNFGADVQDISSPVTEEVHVPKYSLSYGQGWGVTVPQPAMSPPTCAPRCWQSKSGKPSLGCAGPHESNLENRCGPRQRPPTPKRLLLFRKGDQSCCPNEVHVNQFPEDSPRLPSAIQSQLSSAFVVLPPIGKPLIGGEPNLSREQVAGRLNPIQRSCSDGYLAQLERQKQLKERVTYQAYTLRDYQQLKQDVSRPRGLGPDYKTSEKTMRWQKLYSDVVREQNKTTSRILLLPAKHPQGSAKEVPRKKALEYAKNIPKPPVQSQPKLRPRQRHRPEGFSEHVPYLQGLDLSQLTMLEVLRKRHEEEKHAVASFTSMNAA